MEMFNLVDKNYTNMDCFFKANSLGTYRTLKNVELKKYHYWNSNHYIYL